jgi:hypothetical protein
MDPFLQIAEDLLKVRKEVTGNILIDAIGVERIFGKDEVCLMGCTPVGEAITNEKNGIIFFPVDLDEPLFASAAEATFVIGVGERNIHLFTPQKMSAVRIEGDL